MSVALMRATSDSVLSFIRPMNPDDLRTMSVLAMLPSLSITCARGPKQGVKREERKRKEKKPKRKRKVKKKIGWGRKK